MQRQSAVAWVGIGGLRSFLARSLSITCLTITAASAAVNLNQHGLTGPWYNPATSGQGFVVEVFPDLSSPGVASVQVSWFTFDTVAGGASSQRWYTLSGPVRSGQVDAALTIYQNVGGTFNAPPVTNARSVGTATLTFDTCNSGRLTYSFSDGTGRTGIIPLTRLTQNVTCSATSASPTDPDFALSGNWYDPATSGQGLSIEVNGNSASVYAAWYTYVPSGAIGGEAGQRWYTLQSGTFDPGTHAIPVTLYETTGGVFDTPTVPAAKTMSVGTGVLAFQSCSAATLNYSFTGGSGSGLSGGIAAERIGPVPAGCSFSAAGQPALSLGDLSPYVVAVRGMLPPAMIDISQLLGIFLATTRNILNPQAPCPSVGTNPDQTHPDSDHANFTAFADFRPLCSVSNEFAQGTFGGFFSMGVTGLASTYAGASGKFLFNIPSLTRNGYLIANGMVGVALDLALDPASGLFSTGRADRTFTSFSGYLSSLGPVSMAYSGTSVDTFNTATATYNSTFDITAIGATNIPIKLAVTTVRRTDGSMILNSSGLNSAGGYGLKIIDLVFDLDRCPTDPKSGTIAFTKAGQTASFIYDGTCGYIYNGP